MNISKRLSIAAGALLVMASGWASAATITAIPSATSVVQGGTFTVTLVGSEFTTGTTGGPIEAISWDASVLSLAFKCTGSRA